MSSSYSVHRVSPLNEQPDPTPVGTFGSYVEGFLFGRDLVTQDQDNAYGLYSDGVRMGRFGWGRLALQQLGLSPSPHAIHSLDDRYDKDVDELLTS